MPDQKTNRKIGKDVHRLSILIKRYLDVHGHRKRHEEITGSNGWIIRFLLEREDMDVYQKDLEAEFGITRSTASKVIGLMEQKGLVQRQAVAHDARLKKITLTDKTRKIAEEMKRDGSAADQQILKGFSKEEVEKLYEFFDRMLANLEQ
ncbi:MAG: MarR family transcriptional regulator [Clostridiales bacterium]|nr:MarR family transcriptional regulator [Clostridiales bacterium]